MYVVIWRYSVDPAQTRQVREGLRAEGRVGEVLLLGEGLPRHGAPRRRRAPGRIRDHRPLEERGGLQRLPAASTRPTTTGWTGASRRSPCRRAGWAPTASPERRGERPSRSRGWARAIATRPSSSFSPSCAPTRTTSTSPATYGDGGPGGAAACAGSLRREARARLRLDGEARRPRSWAAAWSAYAISTSRGSLVAKLDDVNVRPGLEGQGIGSRCWTRSRTNCARRGVTRIDTATHFDNPGARRFYERHGFATLREERLSCLL